jgi:hypothetical protein
MTGRLRIQTPASPAKAQGRRPAAGSTGRPRWKTAAIVIVVIVVLIGRRDA